MTVAKERLELLFAVLLGGAALLSSPAHGQPTAEERFVAAAQARDFDTMRRLLESPVRFLGDRQMSSSEFVAYISHCRAMNAGGGIMGWVCPPGFDGRNRNWVLAGSLRSNGEKIMLSGLGDPGFPLSPE